VVEVPSAAARCAVGADSMAARLVAEVVASTGEAADTVGADMVAADTGKFACGLI